MTLCNEIREFRLYKFAEPEFSCLFIDGGFGLLSFQMLVEHNNDLVNVEFTSNFHFSSVITIMNDEGFIAADHVRYEKRICSCCGHKQTTIFPNRSD